MVAVLAIAGASAQEFRATVSGTVKDPSGAVIPGAAVQVREVNTGTVNKTVSDAAGQYVVPYLLPGGYTITAEAVGFEKINRAGLTLNANDHPIIDLTLQIGSTDQTVTVTGDAPLLDAANASVNTVISTSSVADLPLNGRTPAALTQLSAGVISTAAPQQVHPFDNNAGNSWSIGGTPNQTSEVLLDGSPDETLLGALAFSPSQDSVQEVSVQPFATDASLGHTIGGVINQVTKSGQNKFHGTMYEFGQISGIDANLYFNSAAWNTSNGVATAKPSPVFHFNQYGLTAGGPVRIPKLYDGRDKLFFFFAWEGLKDSTPAATLMTVPTTTSAAGSPGTGGEANGDFYQVLAAGCASGQVDGYASNGAAQCLSSGKLVADPYQIWDPRSSVLTNGNTTRTPIAKNQLRTVLPNLDAVGLAVAKLYPAPNATGTALGASNYNSNAPSVDNYSNEFGRIDYNAAANDHIFFDVRHNIRSQVKNDYFGNHTTGTTLTRENWGASLDNIYTLNPTTIVDVRLNWMLFFETHGTPAQAFGPASIGMPSALATASNEVQLPAFTLSGGYQTLGDTTSALDPSTNYQIFTDVTKIIGKHTLKVGFDGRQYRLSVTNYGNSSGGFTFNSSWTNAGTSGAGTELGPDLAALELGVPSSGQYDLNARADYHQYYIGSFLQDDYRVNDKLTFNLGLRFDINTPFEERLGKVVNGFNSAATVNYSKAVAFTPSTQTVNGQSFTVSSINLNGGLTFPNQNNGAVFATNSGFFSPRFGFSYGLDSKTVVRGGFGFFVQPETMSNMNSSGTTSSNALSNQEGYSASTSYVTSTNSTTVSGSMSNPFPTLSQPAGSSLGASTFLGSPSAINFLAPSQHDPYSERWNLNVQRQLSGHLMAEVMYVGNHSVHLPVGTQNINAVESQFLTNQPYFSYNMNKAYGTKITNPFLAALGSTNTTGLNTSSTESFGNFLVPFPQYNTTAITEQNQTIGQSWFHAAILHVEQRAAHGLTLTGNYSFSKMTEADSFLNDVDTKTTHRISPFDHTHHFTVGGTYNLPFGKGKMFAFGGNRLWDEILGGYVINGIYQFQSGAPIIFTSDLYLAPGVTSLRQITNNTRGATKAAPALNTAAFVTSANPSACTTTCDGSVNQGGQPYDHYRTLPQTMSWVRQDGYNNLDASILKDFKFTEGSYFQLRFETFNTLNHPIFAAPAVSSGSATGTFGYITATTASSLPRQIQIGGRIVF